MGLPPTKKKKGKRAPRKKKGGIYIPRKKKKKTKTPKKRKKMKPETVADAAAANHTPLFGMAYNPLSVSAFGYLSLPSFDFDGSDSLNSFM